MFKRIFTILIIMTLFSTLCLPVYGTTTKVLPFGISVEYWGDGPTICGVIPSEINLANIGATSIIPYYSTDGVNFIIAGDPEWNDLIVLGGGNFPPLAKSCNEPLLSYLSGAIDKFYMKLAVTGGEYEGDSQIAVIDRNSAIPLPDDYNKIALFPQNMRPAFGSDPNCYNIAVKKGSTLEYILTLLPSTINAEMLMGKDPDVLPRESIPYIATWNLGEDILKKIAACPSGDTVTVQNPATFTPPDSAKATIGDKVYTYTPPATFAEPLELIITVLEDDFATEIYSLYQQRDYSTNKNDLWFSMKQKPSGATSLYAEYSLDGGETWIASTPIGMHSDKPNSSMYNGPTGILQDSTPLKDCNEKKIDGFMIRMVLVGGAFAGTTKPANYPDDYQYVKPGDTDGSGGNRGDAGSNGESDPTPPPENILPEPPVPEVPDTDHTMTILPLPEVPDSGNSAALPDSVIENTPDMSFIGDPTSETDMASDNNYSDNSRPQQIIARNSNDAKNNNASPWRKHSANYFSIIALLSVFSVATLISLFKTTLLKKILPALKSR